MKKEPKQVRHKKVGARMNEDEYRRLQGFYKDTTCRQLSAYIRKVLLHKPVVVKYRNQSADEIMAVMIRLKNELNAIGNNYNQAVHRLHTLDHVPEIKTWALLHEAGRQSLLEKTEEIKSTMIKIYEQWSQR